MSQLETNTETLQAILSAVNSLPDAGSGGEDVSEETAEYTSLLTDLETTIDTLPNAGSSGTSRVFVEYDSGTAPPGNVTLYYVDQEGTAQDETVAASVTIDVTTIKNSLVLFVSADAIGSISSITGGSVVFIYNRVALIQVTGNTCTIAYT